MIHFGLGDQKKVDSLIITWPNSKQTKLFDVKANQVLKINSNSSKRFNSNSKVSKSVIGVKSTILSLAVSEIQLS